LLDECTAGNDANIPRFRTSDLRRQIWIKLESPLERSFAADTRKEHTPREAFVADVFNNYDAARKLQDDRRARRLATGRPDRDFAADNGR
jgi:hypothetical protein